MTTRESSIAETEIDLDDFFNVLADSRRRYVLTLLSKQSMPMAVADVAEELTNWECDVPRDKITHEQVQPRHLALYHKDVPKMEDVGIIEWNQERNTIALREAYEGIAAYVE